ncbi:MAG: SxtJ family membrane protein, partial [Desulfovibrio sp.]|nr:SxtJ family membrane protein [Desulfovibrio sp.]
FLLLGMVAPVVMKPFAAFWFGLSHILGGVSSAVLFSVVYCAILMPVAFVRRCMGKDVLLLRRWKKDSGTCFVNRNHVFAAADFVNPF